MNANDVARLREEGQMASLFGITETTRDDFNRILRVMPFEFSINDARELMDAADIPLGCRGGLFAAAVKAGLITPQYVGTYPLRVPSTGLSAHGATVVVYNRHNYGRAS